MCKLFRPFLFACHSSASPRDQIGGVILALCFTSITCSLLCTLGARLLLGQEESWRLLGATPFHHIARADSLLCQKYLQNTADSYRCTNQQKYPESTQAHVSVSKISKSRLNSEAPTELQRAGRLLAILPIGLLQAFLPFQAPCYLTRKKRVAFFKLSMTQFKRN